MRPHCVVFHTLVVATISKHKRYSGGTLAGSAIFLLLAKRSLSCVRSEVFLGIVGVHSGRRGGNLHKKTAGPLVPAGPAAVYV